jgi:hypothetical protein
MEESDMSLFGGIADAVGDAVGAVVDVVESVGDLAGMAAPFLTAVNPAAGLVLSQFSQQTNVLERIMDGGNGRGGREGCIDSRSRCGSGSGRTGSGSLNITGDESLAVLLAKIFGAQMDKTEKKLRDLAQEASEGSGEGQASKNALIAATASDLTNQASIASKTIGAISDSQTTALGRTN